jgi:hypothetical protein
MPIRRIGFGFKDELLQNFLDFMVSFSIKAHNARHWLHEKKRLADLGKKDAAFISEPFIEGAIRFLKVPGKLAACSSVSIH